MKIAEKKFSEAQEEIESRDLKIGDLASALASSLTASRPVPISVPLLQTSASSSSSTENTSSSRTQASLSTAEEVFSTFSNLSIK